MSREIFATYTGSDDLYAVLRRTTDDKAWNGTSWETWDDTHIDDYAIAMTDRGGDVWNADWPTGMAAGNRVRVIIYSQAGADPAIDDDTVAFYTRTWNGVSADEGGSVDLDPYALTSLDSLKRYMRIPLASTAKDDLLTQIINQASAWIERVTGRKFVARDYRERRDLNRQSLIRLKNYPIIGMPHVAYGNGFIGSLTFTGTCIRACAGVSPTKVTLESVVAAGSKTSTDFVFDTYPTLSLISAAMPSGWTMTYASDRPSWELNPMSGVDARSPSSATLYTADEDDVPFAIDGDNGKLTINTTAIMGSLGTGWVGSGNGSGQYGYPGFNRGSRPFSQRATTGRQPQGLLIEYRAGYETVPADIEMLANEMAQLIYSRGAHDPRETQTSLGPYSASFANADADIVIRARLAAYFDGRVFVA